MKLVKNNRLPGDSGQCRALTNKGSQCSREAQRQGYCHQHYRLLKEKGLLVEASGDKLLTEVPQAPEGLEATGRRHWTRYCKYLVDKKDLYEIYLPGIADLCYLEEQLEDVKKKLNDFGFVNVYDEAIQRNGYASHFDRLIAHIRNLRADYGLTRASSKEAVASGSATEQTANQSAGTGGKNF